MHFSESFKPSGNAPSLVQHAALLLYTYNEVSYILEWVMDMKSGSDRLEKIRTYDSPDCPLEKGKMEWCSHAIMHRYELDMAGHTMDIAGRQILQIKSEYWI